MVSVIVLSFVVVGFNNLRLRRSAVAASPAARCATPKRLRARPHTPPRGALPKPKPPAHIEAFNLAGHDIEVALLVFRSTSYVRTIQENGQW
jgi:hypothetical protein